MSYCREQVQACITQPWNADWCCCDHAGAVLSALVALGENLRIEHLYEGWQRIIALQQQSGEAAPAEQQQLLDMAQQHAANLTGQVGCRAHRKQQHQTLVGLLGSPVSGNA